MDGVALESLTAPLYAVPDHLRAKPYLAIPELEAKLRAGGAYEYAGEMVRRTDPLEDYHRLPLEAFSPFSFDELCKLKYSTTYMMERSVQELFDTSPSHEVVRKIVNSHWHCSVCRENWNEVVAAYDGLRRFTLDLGPAFKLRLDYTTGHNQLGYSKFSRTFLDGIFAFLVYYKGEHVMTVGFSFAEGELILIQQVQLAKQKGNRFLYRFPKNRLEFILGRFAEAFPEHALAVVDGQSLADSIRQNYEAGLEGARHQMRRDANWLATVRDKRSRKRLQKHIKRKYRECEVLEQKIEHLRNDRPRLVEFYNSTGGFVPRATFTNRGLTYHRVV